MGDDTENTDRRVAWVKLGSIWWPGKLLREDEYSDEMKGEVERIKNSKRSKASPDNIHVVKYFNENDYIVTTSPPQILLDVTEEKKVDIVKRVLTSMKSSKLAVRLEEFKRDVKDAEKFLNPSADLTDLLRLLNGESLEPKRPTGISKYADIFPSPKPDKPIQTNQTPVGKGKTGIKFNFPSSRIINVASSKSPSKINPLPSDPSKKYKCSKCAYFSDRVNNVTVHMKYCNGSSPVQSKKNLTQAAVAISTTTTTASPKAKTNPVKVVESPKTKASPVKQVKEEAPTASASPVTTPRRPGRPPKKSMPLLVTSVPASPPKKVATTMAVASSSPVTTPAVPKKRGRRSKKDKQLSDKQKAEILQDWNDSSSEENDTDDELAPMMPPTKPPELFLFGSEKNKKRKADSSPVEEKIDGQEGAKTGTEEVSNEDQPPVLKKPRTDKELSDAFEALLKNTKPEYENLLGKELSTKEHGDEKMEVDEEEEPQLSDIEEDAHILMKKSDPVAVVSEELQHDLKKGDDKEKRALSSEKQDAKTEEDVNVISFKGQTENNEKSEAEQAKVEEPQTKDVDTTPAKAAPQPTELRRSSRRGDRKSETVPVPILSPPVEKKVGSRRGRRASRTNTEEANETKPAEPIKAIVENGSKVGKDPIKKTVSKNLETEKPLSTVQEEQNVAVKSKPELAEKSDGVEAETEVQNVTATTGKEKDEQKKPSKPEMGPKESVNAKEVPKPEDVNSIKESKEKVQFVPETKVSPDASAEIRKIEQQKSNENSEEGTSETPKTVMETAVVTSTPGEKRRVVPTDEPVAAPIEKLKVVHVEPSKTKVEEKPPAVSDNQKLSPAEKPVSTVKAVQETKQLEKPTVATFLPETPSLPPSVATSVSPSKQSKPIQAHEKEVTKAKTPPPASKSLSKSKSPPKVATPCPAKPIVPATSAKLVTSPTKSASVPVTVAQPQPQIPAAAPANPTKVVQKDTPATLPPASAAVIPTKKGTEKKLTVEKKPLESTKPSTASSVGPVTSASASSLQTTIAAAQKPPTAPNLLQQKKPTAAVRPLVDNKEKEAIPVVSTPVKEAKTTVPPPTATSKSVAPTKETQKPTTTVATVTSSEESTSAESKEPSPALVTQRVVHLVPVENADGSITYMLLSLENGSESQAVVLDQSAGDASAGTVLRLDKVESVEPGQASAQNLPLNPNEVEGIFLDKDVENANHIVSALAAAAVEPGSATAASVMDATTTAYVTLAMDPSGAGMALASSSDGSGPSGAQSIVLPEGATTTVPQEGGGEQQVFYMTEDGALLDPQSLGLTFEQLQQLLNQ